MRCGASSVCRVALPRENLRDLVNHTWREQSEERVTGSGFSALKRRRRFVQTVLLKHSIVYTKELITRFRFRKTSVTITKRAGS